MELKYIAKKDDNDKKVSQILLDKLNFSSRLLNKLKMNEKIIVNNVPVFSNYIVHEEDNIIVKIDFIEDDFIKAEKMDLDVLYEDDFFLAINKPAGIVVHPSANHQSNTLANGVKYYLNNHKKIRPINRLDRDTSGIVLFAKNEYIQELMAKEKNMVKEYIAYVNGTLDGKIGTICKPIRRKEDSIMEREVSENGQSAITHYEVLNEITVKKENVEGNFFQDVSQTISIVKLKLETGRTHQIRVHMAYLGTPILGDTLYGTESSLISRQALHAFHLYFCHPITKKEINIYAKIPSDMKRIYSFI